MTRLAADRVLFAARHGRLAASRQGAGGNGLVHDTRDARHVAATSGRGCTRALLLRGLPNRCRRSRVRAWRCVGSRRTQEQAGDKRCGQADHGGRESECEESKQIRNTLNTVRRSRTVRSHHKAHVEGIGKNPTLTPHPDSATAGRMDSATAGRMSALFPHTDRQPRRSRRPRRTCAVAPDARPPHRPRFRTLRRADPAAAPRPGGTAPGRTRAPRGAREQRPAREPHPADGHDRRPLGRRQPGERARLWRAWAA